MLQKIKQLRKELHQNPELSGCEIQTAQRIKTFLQTYHSATAIIEQIGGHGLAAVYEFPQKGATVMIRCELDALPIEEKNAFDYQSKTKGVSHKCGHDGHIAMVAGLVFWIKEQDFCSGKIILLFQPAEETGKGAFEVLQDPKFKALRPDYIFALHNLPNEPLHTILTKPNSFSATVQSMIVHLTGKESHASEPENGTNPALAMAELITEFSKLNRQDLQSEKFTLLTPIHINMGQKSYGISAGAAELHYTLRAWTEEVMAQLKETLQQILNRIGMQYALSYTIDWLEYFPSTTNDPFCNEFVVKAARANGLDCKERAYPLKFGEDFGWFSKHYKTAMFGLGAGMDSPALHHADYDFPEEILETGMGMFKEIIQQIIK